MAQLSRKLERSLQRKLGMGLGGRVGFVVLVCLIVAFGMSFGILFMRASQTERASEAILPLDGWESSAQTTPDSALLISDPEGDSAGNSAGKSATVTASDELAKTDKEPVCAVHVDGAVMCPGVYWIDKNDARVIDAVEAAGGLSEDANTAALNLAAPLSDGAKVHVPRAGEDISNQGALLAPALADGVSYDAEQAATLININSADEAALQTLPGIGPSTAAAIVEDRERNGSFVVPEDIMRVSGIGEKKFERIQGHICVS